MGIGAVLCTEELMLWVMMGSKGTWALCNIDRYQRLRPTQTVG
jgi:hypothetical protein